MAFSRYLNPKNDVAFKKIFGSEKNKDIVIHFLNDIIGSFKNSHIVEIDFLPTILIPNSDAQKISIVDVLCKDREGAKYIIEMQVSSTRGFEKRAQHYAAKVYSDQARVGQEYQDLKEIIFLAIADDIIFPNKAHYKSDHIVMDNKTYEHDLKDFYFTFIELPKFKKNKEELFSMEEKWCYFFKHAHETTESDLERILGSNNIIHKAYSALNQFYWTEGELLAYDANQRINMDHKAILDKKYDEGEAKGIEKEKIQTAKRLLQDGLAIDLISRYTDLSKEQIEDLRKYTLEEPSVVNF
ncbi:MAG TPA: Rpn family recombination-promoting nuclease/putative transposase [Candidatus Rhabdochlamydia sp.]|jgi:predicted transposase/invertase (TIGR01784 family)|nr:Rpn family recombination-promoting nuclease/putative transposase [Candidatus Rhabdochlamydia sp.]